MDEIALSSYFAFGEFDREIEQKLAAVAKPPAEVAEPLLDARPALRPLWSELERLPFDSVYPNYLNHPARVAGSLLALQPHVDDSALALALCHNVREAGLADALVLSGEVAEAVDVLTIDRARERDDRYLETYYDGVEAAGLIVLKALDKLDNALEWVRFDVEERAAAVVLGHVVPRVERVEPALGDYLGRLTRYVGSDGARARFAAVA